MYTSFCNADSSRLARDSDQGLLELLGHGSLHGLQLLWLPHGSVCHWQWGWATVWLVPIVHLPGCWCPHWVVGLVSCLVHWKFGPFNPAFFISFEILKWEERLGLKLLC